MMILTDRQVFVTGVDLGVIVSICSPKGIEIARGGWAWAGVDAGKPADIRVRTFDRGHMAVEALTVDGRAFLDLMAEDEPATFEEWASVVACD